MYTSVQLEPSYSIRTDGETDRRDEANSLVPQFCENRLKREPMKRGEQIANTFSAAIWQ